MFIIQRLLGPLAVDIRAACSPDRAACTPDRAVRSLAVVRRRAVGSLAVGSRESVGRQLTDRKLVVVVA